LNILVIHGCAPPEDAAWPWSTAQGNVSIRQLGCADLPERIAEADFVAVAVSCGTQLELWAAAETLLAARKLPMMAFEPMRAQALCAIRLGGACIATPTHNGGIELQCRAQQLAFQRIAMSMRDEGKGPSETPVDDKGERTTRFIFQGN
jgi:hypothetical protein